MRKIWKAIQIVWAVSAVSFCTIVGTAYGWETYGFGGAVGCGLLGLLIGCIVAAGPQLIMMAA